MQNTEDVPRKRRHEIVRILLFLGIAVVSRVAVYLLMVVMMALLGIGVDDLDASNRLVYGSYLMF